MQFPLKCAVLPYHTYQGGLSEGRSSRATRINWTHPGIEKVTAWRVQLPLLDRDGSTNMHPVLAEHRIETIHRCEILRFCCQLVQVHVRLNGCDLVVVWVLAS